MGGHKLDLHALFNVVLANQVCARYTLFSIPEVIACFCALLPPHCNILYTVSLLRLVLVLVNFAPSFSSSSSPTLGRCSDL